jgi:hypothetical protein
MYVKSIQIGFQENLDIDIGKRKSSSKVIYLLKTGCFRNPQNGNFFCRLRSFIDTCKKQKLPILNSILVVFKTGAFQFER